MATLIIESHQGGRHDIHYHRVESFPYNIGRAYNNDLILADDTVSPHHLQIDHNEDGYSIRNLSHENGTWDGDRRLSEDVEALKPPLTLTLGRAHIRILVSDTAIAPTRHFPHASWITRWASDLRVALGLLALYLLLSAYFALEKQSMWLNWGEVVFSQLPEVVLPLLAATVIGFISRLLLHRWRFPLQLSIACIALGVLMFSGDVFDIMSYWVTSDQFASQASTLFIGLSAIGLFAWQLRAVSTLSRKQATWTSAAIVVPTLLILELQTIISQPTFQIQAPIHTLLKAGDIRLAKNYQSTEDFRQSVEAELQHGLELELAKDK